MITSLREHIENTLEMPVHFVHITQNESMPCATIREVDLVSTQALARAKEGRVSGVTVTLWDLSYIDLQAATDTLLDAYDGMYLTIGSFGCKFLLQDGSDDSYANPDGSDDWIYAKEITFSVHYRRTA